MRREFQVRFCERVGGSQFGLLPALLDKKTFTASSGLVGSVFATAIQNKPQNIPLGLYFEAY